MAIPAVRAQIHWHERLVDGRYRVDEVLVFDRDGAIPDDGDYDSSSGACNADWLDGTDPRSTPAGVYAATAHQGFVDDEAESEALLKLGQIEGCEWATQLGSALRLLRA